MTATPTHASKPVAIVTGANTGIGLVTATELARKGYHVIITCRSREKAEATIHKVRADTGTEAGYLALDLAEPASVRRAADLFLEQGRPLQLLINNAGVARLRGVASSGFETTFATNHLGTFLFTNLLLPRMVESGPARIVTVASEAHYFAKGIPWDSLRTPTSYSGMTEYSVSKLANVLFSAELARILKGTSVTTYALHPGKVATDVWRNAPSVLQRVVRMTMMSAEEGAITSLFCATSQSVAAQSGLYYDTCNVRAPSKEARDEALAAELWRRSLEWTGLAPRAQPEPAQASQALRTPGVNT